MLKFNTDKPIYAQIVDLVQMRIIKGIYPPQSQLPSVRDFAMELGVNPNTVQRALSGLEQTGFVKCERTAGRFVTSDTKLINDTREALMKSMARDFILAMKRCGCSDKEIIEICISCMGTTTEGAGGEN
jgi:DNA-binding transcriptional regulator YhcF (GntR family)